ncbi:MAG TPA: M67 family metallopeptidase [Acidimicrobiia bacterium]|nr:M67 family metallopeptidase [Acidimicrobiia bacterium]
MHLPGQIREAMIAHARFSYPEEACGLVAADGDGRLRMAYCLTNTEGSPVAFTLDPTEHMRAWRHAERNGWQLAGVFHSHTHTAAFPSRTDVARALEPEWVYLLVSLEREDQPDVRGYWIRDGKVTEEPLVEAEAMETSS